MNAQIIPFYANSEKSTGSAFAGEQLNPASKRYLIQELNDVYNNHKDSNWDKEGAEKISFVALQQSFKFIELFTNEFNLPEINPDNDGYIEFEWFSDPASISFYVTPSDVVLFAAYFSINNRFSGRFNMSEGIPKWLSEQVENL